MKSIYRTITILGITTVLGGLGVVQPQTSQASAVKEQAVDFLNRGLEKAKKKDYRGKLALL